MRGRFFIIGLCLLAAAAFSVASGLARTPVAQAGERFQACPTDRTGAYSVCQSGGTRPRQITDGIREVIRDTGRGGLVRITMYQWSIPRLTRALIRRMRAPDRFEAQVVLERDYRNETAVRRLRGAGVNVILCRSGCLDRGVNHNKLVLASDRRGTVVSIGSFNFKAAHEGLFNDMVFVRDDPSLFEFYSEYFDRLRAGSWRGWSDAQRSRPGSGPTHGYVFPRKGDREDPDYDAPAQLLRSIDDCRHNGRRGTVWVAMAFFDRRRNEVVRALDRLQDELGCDVRVVTSSAARERGLERNYRGHRLDRESVRHEGRLHHKFFVVDASYQGEWQKFTVTGSHNFTRRALRANDDASALVADGWVTKRYKARFRTLWSVARDR